MTNIPNCVIAQRGLAQYLLFDKPDLITHAIRHGDGWEEHLLSVSEKLLSDSTDGVVLDIGACFGTYSIPLAQKFTNMMFYAFEPQRIVFYQLCANIIINSLVNVVSRNYAISDQNLNLQSIVPDYGIETNIGAFSLDQETRDNRYECISKGPTEDIEIRNIDGHNFTNVKLIKIDVEGLELQVLRGAIKTIKENDYPAIIFETWTDKPWYQAKRDEIIGFVKSLGYNVISIGENNIAQHESRRQINFKFEKYRSNKPLALTTIPIWKTIIDGEL